MTTMMIMSPFGQLGLWAPSSGVDPRQIHINLDSDDDDDDNKPVWPTWAVGALFRGARRIHINRDRDDDDDDNERVCPTWAGGALASGLYCSSSH